MAKIQNISEIHPTLGFTEFDVLENTVRVLMRVSLAGFTQCFRLIVWQKPQAVGTATGTQEYLQPAAKIASWS